VLHSLVKSQPLISLILSPWALRVYPWLRHIFSASSHTHPRLPHMSALSYALPGLICLFVAFKIDHTLGTSFCLDSLSLTIKVNLIFLSFLFYSWTWGTRTFKPFLWLPSLLLSSGNTKTLTFSSSNILYLLFRRLGRCCLDFYKDVQNM
jgi:hypothetical protein